MFSVNDLIMMSPHQGWPFLCSQREPWLCGCCCSKANVNGLEELAPGCELTEVPGVYPDGPPENVRVMVSNH